MKSVDWESRNTENYLDHYSHNFRNDGMDLATWKARKRRVNADKSWIKVDLGSLSILRDSGTEPLVVVTFEQDYRSSILSTRLRKRQYWIVEDGRWKIAHEEGVGRSTNSLPDSSRPEALCPPMSWNVRTSGYWRSSS